MKELVLIKPVGSKLEPYTTADRVAEYAGVQHRTINRLIQQHEKDLEEFGVLRFEIALPSPGSKGGRPEKAYYLNEQQATLLVTYLKNTAPVRRFKKNLVREFFKARQDLAHRRELREAGKPVQRELTDAIRDSGEGERMHGHAFNTYQNLIYKAAMGRNASQVKRERGAAKDSRAVDFLTSDELQAVEKKKRLVIGLLDEGFQYEAIRALLLREGT